MTDKVKSFWERHNGWLLQIAGLLVTFGVIYGSINESLKNRPDRNEVNCTIDAKIQKHVEDSKEIYIKIDQVPGLNEKLENINAQLKDVKEQNNIIIQNISRVKK